MIMDKHKEAEVREAFASLYKSNKEALAELIVEYFDPNHITVDYISMLLNTRVLKPGDQLVKKVRKGWVVRTLYPGSIHLASEITSEDRANYHLSGVDIKVHMNEWELESGELGTLDNIESQMRAYIRDYYLTQVINALANLWDATNTPSNYADVSGSITASALETAIEPISGYMEQSI